jgi:RsiW-degrading membrane proteinase PrsW (M82 family)
MESALEISKMGIASISVLLAFVPIIAWGLHFLKKHPEKRKLVLITFIGGAVSVVPLLIYKYLWQWFPWINAFDWIRNTNFDLFGINSLLLIPIPVLITFLLVGVIEEISKIYSVKILDKDRFLSVDDAIEFAIVAGLGFAFVENALYFQNIIATRGIDNFAFPFVFRSLFSTFAHVMFSGIFGYFYGVAHFADPILKKKMRKERHPILNFLHKISHFKKSTLFHEEKILEGLIVATLLHAAFNVFLEMEWLIAIVPFLAIGYLVLDNLIGRKENLVNLKRLLPERTSGRK